MRPDGGVSCRGREAVVTARLATGRWQQHSGVITYASLRIEVLRGCGKPLPAHPLPC
jgi:hypothetical protein